MNLFFEQLISRRNFLKKCGLIAASTAFAPKLLRFAEAQNAKLGFVDAQPAAYYETLADKRIKCTLCPRTCIVDNGKRGFCRVRENRNGIYYTLVHSNPCALHIDPIEKKPLYHFLPGTTALSLATAGCNFTCKNCQNWDISQSKPDDTYNFPVTPQDIVALAVQYNTPTIAYTYTEPTVFFEYMRDTAKHAHAKGIKNIYHSNGYINPQPLEDIIDYLDGANVDLKAYSNDFYKDITGGTLFPVLTTLQTLKQAGVWLEITNLVIPTKNDSEALIRALCNWICDALGDDVPVHFSRFYPHYRLQNIHPTPVDTLQKASEIASIAGLKYIYIGNVPNVREEHTYCPACKKQVIERHGYSINAHGLNKGTCTFCSTHLSGVW